MSKSMTSEGSLVPWNPVDGNSVDEIFDKNVRLLNESNQNLATHSPTLPLYQSYVQIG